MLARVLPFVLSALLLQTSLPALRVAAQVDPAAEEMRAKVERLGTGRRVKVRMRNGTRFEGHLGDIGEESFVVVKNRKRGETTRVAYADVSDVGKKMSARNKFLIGLAVVGFVVLTVLAIKYADECGAARVATDDPCPPECTDC
ncbi:MAG TPA: hypothetical protein VEQ42_08065 [Pyrinomonadaceae bacterium]|nr:hypothetical protein [Pyrinomonadaceae bacterium]